MPDEITLFSECYADTALVGLLAKQNQTVEHVAGINEVAKALIHVAANEGKAIGIVDNDKQKPLYFDTFEVVVDEHRVCLRRNLTSNQFLVVIDKAIESFLLWNAVQVGIEIATYGFNEDVKVIRRRLKTFTIETDPNYLQLLADLYARQAPGFLTLERILNDLIIT